MKPRKVTDEGEINIWPCIEARQQSTPLSIKDERWEYLGQLDADSIL